MSIELCSVTYYLYSLILYVLPYAGLGRPSGEGSIGIGLDSCVIPTRHKGTTLIQTTDLYPMIIYSVYYHRTPCHSHSMPYSVTLGIYSLLFPHGLELLTIMVLVL